MSNHAFLLYFFVLLGECLNITSTEKSMPRGIDQHTWGVNQSGLYQNILYPVIDNERKAMRKA